MGLLIFCVNLSRLVCEMVFLKVSFLLRVVVVSVDVVWYFGSRVVIGVI